MGIERIGLLHRFDGTKPGGLVLIEAPAGFGKTYALAQWCSRAAAEGWIVTWIGLQSTDGRAEGFARTMSGALGLTDVSGLPAIPVDMQHAADRLSEFVAELIASITKLGRRVLLVFDDYHVIDGSPVDGLLEQLFNRIPPNLLIALASRRVRPFTASRALLQGRLLRLDHHSLAFTKSEARALLGGSLGLAQFNALYSLTEGWPAALRMSQLCLPEWPKSSGDIRHAPEFTRMIRGYCTHEVLRETGAEALELLVDCSVVDALDPDLCNAIRRRTDSGPILAQLATHETFMQAVDVAANRWRLPSLLRYSLHCQAAERGKDTVSAANLRTSEYFEALGQTSSALRHALAAGTPEVAAAVLERSAPLVMLTKQGDACCQELLDLIPRSQIQNFPRLALCRTLLDYKRGLLEEARTSLAELGARTRDFTVDRPGGNDALLQAEFLCVRLVMEIYGCSNVRRSRLDDIEQELPTVNRSDVRLATIFQLGLGVLCQQRGDLEAAEAHFIQCKKLIISTQPPATTMWLKYHDGAIALSRGRLMDARYHLQTGLKLWRGNFLTYPTYGAACKIALAEIDYETDSLAAARTKLGEGLYIAEHIEGWFDLYASLYESSLMLHWQGGNLDQVEALLARGEVIHRIGVLLERFLPILRLRFELLRGRLDIAQSIADRNRFGERWHAATFQDGFAYREWDLLGACLCHLALQRGELAEARHILSLLDQTARSAGRSRTVARAALLSAIVDYQEGQSKSAVAHMLDALAIGQPLGYRRVFLDEGPMALPILDAVSSVDAAEAPAYLAAYARSLRNAFVESWERSDARDEGAVLSERELQVLRELSLGHSDKLIARKLELSATTVKFHVNNIFRKLEVHKRTAAVAEAHRRRLLS